MVSVNLGTVSRWGLNFLALLGFFIALRLGESVFIPAIIALLLAALLWPIVYWLHHRLRLPWSLACMVVLTGLILLNVFITVGFAASIPRMLQGLPDPRDAHGQQQLYTKVRTQVARISPLLLDPDLWPEESEKSRAFQFVQETFKGPVVADMVLRFSYWTTSWIWEWILILFILLFLLMEGRMLSRRVVEIAGPSKEVQSRAIAALTDMAHQVRNFLLWRTVINVGLGLVVGTVYHAMGLKEPWTWALLTAVACYVPYLGPIVAGVPAIIDGFANLSSPAYAFVLIIFYVGIITLEGYVVVPVVMGRSMALNATTVMLSCLFWELVWGLPGLFLAMPLMAAIKTICWHMPGMRPWANLMSDNENDPAEAEPPDPPQPRHDADATLIINEPAADLLADLPVGKK